jgi:protein-S-isoprenylcysteine O-methyltransferase Ste14
VSGALVLDEFTWVRAGMWVALLVDLVIKLRYEEHLLAQVFGAYEEYRRGSYRLIPWVY